MQLDGKVAVVTGGGSGIGAGIARLFAAEGARVVVVGRRAEQLEAIAAASGGEVRAIATDIADNAQVQALVDQVIGHYGRIDILVNNAGINTSARRMEQLSAEDWGQLLDVNATGSFNVIRAVLPHMRAQRDGLIISVSSIAGYRPSALAGAAYSAGKSALAALTKVVALEEHANGIRTTVIYPGEVDTPLLDKRPVPVSAEQRARILQPDDVAAAALFIAALPPRATVPEFLITPASNPLG